MERGKYPFTKVVQNLGLQAPRCAELDGRPLRTKNVADRVESKATALVFKLACQAYLGLLSSLKVPEESLGGLEQHKTRRKKATFVKNVQEWMGVLVEEGNSPTLEGVAALGLLRVTVGPGAKDALLRQQAIQAIVKDPSAEQILKNHQPIFDSARLLQDADPYQNFPNLTVKSQAELWDLINGES